MSDSRLTPFLAKGWLLVAIQFVLITVLAAGAFGRWTTGTPPSAPAIVLLLAGVGLGVWAMLAMQTANFSVLPVPREGASLITRGPYRWIRHPMYAAVLLACAGLVLNLSEPMLWIAWILLAVNLIVKLNLEEHLLATRHAAYADYRRRTARLIPRVF